MQIIFSPPPPPPPLRRRVELDRGRGFDADSRCAASTDADTSSTSTRCRYSATCHRAFRSSPRYASPTGEAKYVTLGAAATRHTTPVGRTGQELTQKAVVAINHHTTRTPERNVYPLLVHLALIWASFFFFFFCCASFGIQIKYTLSVLSLS